MRLHSVRGIPEAGQAGGVGTQARPVPASKPSAHCRLLGHHLATQQPGEPHLTSITAGGPAAP